MSAKRISESDAERVVKRYADTVYRLAYARCGNRYDADDVFGEVFLRYSRANPEFESEEHEKAWFLRVTVNCANSFLSASARRRSDELTEDIQAPEAPQSADLSYYLSRLNAAEREVLHLFYYEDMPTARIARLLRRRESTVRSQLARAREKLRKLMGDDFRD